MIPAFAHSILLTGLKKGGEVLIDHLGRTTKATEKESISSVVTEADLASEKAILEVLHGAPEAFNVIMRGDRVYRQTIRIHLGGGSAGWNLQFCSWIALVWGDHRPVQRKYPGSGRHVPSSGSQLYLAEAGGGATRNGEPISVTTSANLSEQLVAYSFDFSEDQAKTRAEMEIMASLSRKVRNIRSTNSLLDFCYTADGRLGAALNQTTKIWDIAVPWLMIREGGGTVTDIHGQRSNSTYLPKQ